MVWLHVQPDSYGRVAPMLGRVARVEDGHCAVRVYSAARKAWLKRNVAAGELDAAAAPEIARLVELEKA